MNRSLSSKAAKKPSPAHNNKKKKKKEEEEAPEKKKKTPRNPLQDLNNGSSKVAASSSSSISIEAPKGCLRFFLSHTHTSSSSNLKTPIRPKVVKTTTTTTTTTHHLSKPAPKSAPHKFNNTSSSSSCLPSSRNSQKLKPLNNLKPKSLIKSKSSSGFSSDANITTPLCKGKVVATTTGLDHKTDEVKEEEDVQLKSESTTPPVQASVSPEIQFASSSAAAVSSSSSSVACCYAAGHVLSGIADKRKCRPRGILNVGDKAFCRFDDDDDDDNEEDRDGNVLLPLPTEASMHWILSPCNEEDEDYSDTSGLDPFERRKEVCFEDLTLKDDESQCIYDFDAESSPFSVASLGSGNVIVTPQSESSNADNSRRRQYDSELSSVAEAIRMVSLSPNGHQVIEDQVDSSFQFDCLTTTCDSISRIQKMLDHQAAAWHSSSTLETVSQSQMRVSWREGLMSRMYDMDDEQDCCKCLSDNEKETNDGCSDDPPQKSCQSSGVASNDGGDQTLTDSSCSAGMPDHVPGFAGKVKQDFPRQPSRLCAKSISIDGGGLVASGDSDWHLCYKNKLFHV